MLPSSSTSALLLIGYYVRGQTRVTQTYRIPADLDSPCQESVPYVLSDLTYVALSVRWYIHVSCASTGRAIQLHAGISTHRCADASICIHASTHGYSDRLIDAGGK